MKPKFADYAEAHAASEALYRQEHKSATGNTVARADAEKRAADRRHAREELMAVQFGAAPASKSGAPASAEDAAHAREWFFADDGAAAALAAAEPPGNA
jgi:hypothetical protein